MRSASSDDIETTSVRSMRYNLLDVPQREEMDRGEETKSRVCQTAYELFLEYGAPSEKCFKRGAATCGVIVVVSAVVGVIIKSPWAYGAAAVSACCTCYAGTGYLCERSNWKCCS